MATGPDDTNVTQNDDDAFAEAFGQAIAEADGRDPEPSKKTEEKTDEPTDALKDDDAASKAAEEGAGGAAASGEDGDKATDAGGPGDDGKQPTVPDTAARGDNTELIEAIKALVPKAPEKKEEPAPSREEPEIPEPKFYEYTEEEKKVLETYNKEWDEHARAIELREKKLVHDLTQRLTHQYTKALSVVLQQIEQGLAPVLQNHVESAQERHFSTIRAKHSDFETLKPDVETWIAQQPKYLQPHLRKTYDEGDAAAVIELYDDFKKATGRAQSQATPPGSGAAPRKDEVPAHKAADLTPVTSKRTAIQPSSSGQPDPNDYDAAFDEAVKSYAR